MDSREKVICNGLTFPSRGEVYKFIILAKDLTLLVCYDLITCSGPSGIIFTVENTVVQFFQD